MACRAALFVVVVYIHYFPVASYKSPLKALYGDFSFWGVFIENLLDFLSVHDIIIERAKSEVIF